jgi:hypothetical protein
VSYPEFMWQGQIDSEAGTATFRVGGEKWAVEFPSFVDAHMLQNALAKAYIHGFRDAQESAKASVCNSIDRMSP